MNRNLILGISGVAVVAVLLGGYWYFGGSKIPGTNTPSDMATTTARTPNYTIEQVALPTLKDSAPSLERGVHFADSVPQEVKDLILKKYDTLKPRLVADPARADDWFDLALLYHSAGDFEGARDVWLFLLKVIPASSDAVLYDNLGKLYKFDLKDYPKSENYFKLSIKTDPKSLTPYTELFELYRYLYKTDTSAAVDIITQAAAKFPESPDPYTLLGSYYRDKKQYDLARDAFTKALDLARTMHNVSLIDAIGQEIANLPH